MKRKKPMIKFEQTPLDESLITFKDYPLFDYKLINNEKLENQDDYRVVLDACSLEQATFSNNKFLKTEFIDCTFNNCDLSNNTFTESSFIRCEFIDCKFIGTHIVDSYIDNCYFKNCNMRYLDLAENKFKVVEILDSILQESNWFENEVKHLSFDNNNLEKSTVYNNPFQKLDISTCDINDMRIDLASLKGLEIAAYQAEQFCHLLGIKVK